MMQYVCIRVYNNGRGMNGIYPCLYEFLSAAEHQCATLNKERLDESSEDRWIPCPLYPYESAVWKKSINEKENV